ncbi:unnamed protein product [Cuscuta campestris]|uniref:RING-type E3 ubiquitin transferase n=1 Tax=Cuscuta campestris TaxID=132261 RepID=A0A484KXY3_9ASTE|nr:unnamed protein product [Cuscuta campestris]
MEGLTNDIVSSSRKTTTSDMAAKHGIVSLPSIVFFFLAILLLSPRAAAQPSTRAAGDEAYTYKNFSPSMAIIIVVLVAALFFMGFFSIYVRHCSESSAGNSVRQALSLRRRAAARGLDASVIETFPTFSYAEVKDHKIGKGALECAVCLNEFEDDETLRLIPKCDHVFHPECIDAWLESHVTCPVCRANLTPQPGDDPVYQRPEPVIQPPQNDDVSVNIEAHPQQEDGETSGVNRPPRSFSIKRPRVLTKFRSHSTGHSLVLPGADLERYTLKLPVEVRKEVMNRARSVAVHFPRNASSRRGYRTGGEGSSRAGRSYRRMERLDGESRSDRWGFSIFSRWPSMRSPKVVADNGGETSTSGMKKSVRLPSFRRSEPKGDEAGLVSSDSARPPV